MEKKLAKTVAEMSLMAVLLYSMKMCSLIAKFLLVKIVVLKHTLTLYRQKQILKGR